MREIVYTAISELKPASRNPQGHDLEILKESFRRFGFTIPILWCERKQAIAAGHGRIEGLAEMRDVADECPEGVFATDDGEWMVPVIRGWSSKDDAEFEAYLIADNQIPQIGGQDEELLAQMLREIMEGPGLVGTGFTKDDLVDLENAQEFLNQAEGLSTSERTAAYERAGIRSIVLPFAGAMYEEMIVNLAKARSKLSAESNSDLIYKLVNDALG